MRKPPSDIPPRLPRWPGNRAFRTPRRLKDHAKDIRLTFAHSTT
ncbi:hypothetical protein ACFVU0_26275 [Streptomyces sp. NPDC058122]